MLLNAQTIWHRCMLARKKDRAQSAIQIEETLGKLGGHVVIVNAVKGNTLDKNALVTHGLLAPPNDGTTLRDCYGRIIPSGQIGCALSHAKVQAMIAEQDREFGVIFED